MFCWSHDVRKIHIDNFIQKQCWDKKNERYYGDVKNYKQTVFTSKSPGGMKEQLLKLLTSLGVTSYTWIQLFSSDYRKTKTKAITGTMVNHMQHTQTTQWANENSKQIDLTDAKR